MSLTSANLIGYQRGEFEKAARLRVWLFVLQLLVALPAAVAVVITDQQRDILYWLGVVGALLLLIWWVVNGRYTRVENAAQAARRGATLLGGLDEPLSPAEVQALRERFTITEDEAQKCEMANFFATKLPPGPARLGEMLEESAFYSEHLQRISANVMLVLLGIFAAIFIVIAFSVPYVKPDTAQTIVRVFLAMLVFVMSSDVIGAYRAHRAAAQQIRDIRQRLMRADAADYPSTDVMLAFADYNSAVEGAPESVPKAYAMSAKHLNKRWADYQRDREDKRAARRGR
jgi:hypothetical protein